MKRVVARMAGMIPTELLMSVCGIGLMLLIVTIFIDRSVAVEHSRDLLRANQTQRILGAILQYQIDHGGAYPADIPIFDGQSTMIGLPGQVCTNTCPNMAVHPECIELEKLVPEYMESIPQDPFFTALGPSGYYIHRNARGSAITVGACQSEAAILIESTR